MRSLVFVPVALRRSAWIGCLVALAVVVGVVYGLPSSVAAQQQNPQRMFNLDAGFIQAQIRSDRTADFEMVMQKVKDALRNSENSTRKQQIRGWKVFKMAESGGPNAVIYFMIIDPPVADADYTISTILAEGYPGGEGQQLYDTFSGSFAGGINAMNLELVNDFSR